MELTQEIKDKAYEIRGELLERALELGASEEELTAWSKVPAIVSFLNGAALAFARDPEAFERYQARRA